VDGVRRKEAWSLRARSLAPAMRLLAVKKPGKVSNYYRLKRKREITHVSLPFSARVDGQHGEKISTSLKNQQG